jgi:hypothetical protein
VSHTDVRRVMTLLHVRQQPSTRRGHVRADRHAFRRGVTTPIGALIF